VVHQSHKEEDVAPAVVTAASEATERWFYGGGIHRWLVMNEDTDGAFFLHEEVLEGGKSTPLHTHPAIETMVVLEGAILMHISGRESRVEAGGVAVAPAGEPHAFHVLTDTARLLCLHTPGTCQAFYLEASAPLDDRTERCVDFDRVRSAGTATGGMTIVGPPPFLGR